MQRTRTLLWTLALACVILLMPLLPIDESQTESLTLEKVLRDVRSSLPKPTPPLAVGELTNLQAPQAAKAVIQGLSPASGQSPYPISVTRSPSDRLTVIAHPPPGGEKVQRSRLIPSWTSLLPPLVAIFIALAFRSLLPALFSAVWLGATLVHQTNPITGLYHTLSGPILTSLTDEFNLWVFVFTFALFGMVSVITLAGGSQGLVNAVARFARGPRSTQIATSLMGVAVFFDDYANTIIVGTTMRPMSDRHRISREKLAYLVDSTAAPVAGLAIISTWIGFEVGLFQKLAEELSLGVDGYYLFFQALPYRFYCIFTLIFVFAVSGLGRDFGPMLKAERRAATTGEVIRPGATPLTSRSFSAITNKENIPCRWINAVAPVGVVLLSTVIGMLISGSSSDQMAGKPLDLLTMETWRSCFSGANNVKVLGISALLGSATIIVMAAAQRILSFKEGGLAWVKGVRSMGFAGAILLMAWSIRSVCDDLGTSLFLVAALRDIVAPWSLPLLIFATAALVAFATGTSWGTMGILIPAAIPLALELGDPTIMIISCGAVLDGAIFGDHCSPISDTTVMSSIATSCDHLDHVRTQIPYAMVAMSVAALTGYLPSAMGVPLPWPYLAGTFLVMAILMVLGRRVTERQRALNSDAPRAAAE